MITSSRRVEPGQLWETKDSRDRGRRVRVLSLARNVGGPYAVVETTVAAPGRPTGVGRQSRVKVVQVGSRSYLSGWKLVQNADGTVA